MPEKLTYLLLAGLLLSTVAEANDPYPGMDTTKKVFLKDAGWCWYEDPRAIIHQGKLVVGGISGVSGDIRVGIYDLEKEKMLGEVVLDEGFERDDHNSPVFYIRPDGSLLAMWAMHGQEKYHYFRISDAKDYLKWGELRVLEHDFDIPEGQNWKGVTYMNLYSIGKQERLYNFFRDGPNYNPSFVSSDDHGLSWSGTEHFIRDEVDGRNRPYVRYLQLDKNRIGFSFTDAHPRVYGNSIYYAAFDGNSYFNADGSKIKDLNEGALAPSEAEKIFQGSETREKPEGFGSVPHSAWTCAMASDREGHPHLGYTLYMNNQDNRFRLASWTGREWFDREIAFAGEGLYPKESSYTGLMALDPEHPEYLVISTPVDPETGRETGGKHELYMASAGTRDDKQNITWRQLTTNSAHRNIRPLIVSGEGYKVLLWLAGPWRSYTDYESDVVGLILEKPEKKQPNILIILADDQGWADVGFNGCTDIPTPHLDALARDGVICSQAYASHPYCSPSRAGLLSGRYQQRFGHENNMPYTKATAEDGLPLDEMMLSELLLKEGYQTCAVGKWHLGDSAKFWPVKRGFEDWFGFWGGGMSYWGLPNKGPQSGVLRNGTPVDKDKLSYLTDDFSDAAIDYIDQYAEKEKPFFIYLAYNAPHLPLQATRQYTDMVKHIEDGQRAAYAAMVVGMDQGVGRVINKLKETGEYENTLIFYYSDNGGHGSGASNAPFRGHKGMLFEGGIRVPFSITWPRGLEGDRVYTEAVSALDIFPTILAAGGIDCPPQKKLDGINLLPHLRGKQPGAPHELLFWRYSEGAGYAVLKGKFKLVHSAYKQQTMLFDLHSDPYEQRDLAEEMPGRLAELEKHYADWNKENISAKWQDPHAENVAKEEARRQKYIDDATRGESRK